MRTPSLARWLRCPNACHGQHSLALPAPLRSHTCLPHHACTAVVGVLKGTLAVVLGFVLLGGMGPLGYTRLGVFGIGLNCLGGAW